MSEQIVIDFELDASGLVCPDPLMMLHNKIGEMQEGDVLRLLATDPSTQRDVLKFCHFLGHELLESRSDNDRYLYVIRKQSSPQSVE